MEEEWSSTIMLEDKANNILVEMKVRHSQERTFSITRVIKTITVAEKAKV
jgi:hypothetical protein